MVELKDREPDWMIRMVQDFIDNEVEETAQRKYNLNNWKTMMTEEEEIKLNEEVIGSAENEEVIASVKVNETARAELPNPRWSFESTWYSAGDYGFSLWGVKDLYSGVTWVPANPSPTQHQDLRNKVEAFFWELHERDRLGVGGAAEDEDWGDLTNPVSSTEGLSLTNAQAESFKLQQRVKALTANLAVSYAVETILLVELDALKQDLSEDMQARLTRCFNVVEALEESLNAQYETWI